MKYLAFIFAFTLCCCFISCVEETSLTDELTVEQEAQELTSRSNYLCVSSNPSFPNTNCITPLPFGAFDVNSVLLPGGQCLVVIELAPWVGPGEYCAFNAANGILSCGPLPSSGTIVSPNPPPPNVIQFVMDNPGPFVFNVQAKGFGPDCYSEVFVGC